MDQRFKHKITTDAAGLVADEALGDPRGTRRRARARSRGGAALLDHGLGAEHLGDERVAARAGLELVHLDEHRLPLRRRRRHGYGKKNTGE
uniref:Uncharacterized protein n=1 Tax=Oryza nivara TaxID=4536 RepID=A0A0E0FTA4_ORYNI